MGNPQVGGPDQSLQVIQLINPSSRTLVFNYGGRKITVIGERLLEDAMISKAEEILKGEPHIVNKLIKLEGNALEKLFTAFPDRKNEGITSAVLHIIVNEPSEHRKEPQTLTGKPSHAASLNETSTHTTQQPPLPPRAHRQQLQLNENRKTDVNLPPTLLGKPSRAGFKETETPTPQQPPIPPRTARQLESPRNVNPPLNIKGNSQMILNTPPDFAKPPVPPRTKKPLSSFTPVNSESDLSNQKNLTSNPTSTVQPTKLQPPPLPIKPPSNPSPLANKPPPLPLNPPTSTPNYRRIGPTQQ